MIVKTRESNETVKKFLEDLSPKDFKALGTDHIAYIRPIENDGEALFGVFGADGEQLSLKHSLDQAITATRANDLEPITVH